MESLKGASDPSDLYLVGQQAQRPPRNPSRCISLAKNLSKLVEGRAKHHRASSDSFLMDEQPAWLDELLSEPDSPVASKGHRRSASDSVAYLDKAFIPVTEDSRLKCYIVGPSWGFPSIGYHDDLWQWNSFGRYQSEMPMRKDIGPKSWSSGSLHKLGYSSSKPFEKQVREGKEGSSTKTDGSQASASSRTDSKRAKQQNAHRARLRRLQYMAELERNVQMLQVEGFEVSSAIRYFDQQILRLSMENRALKQRLDSLAQMQKVKQLEQDMLEREIRRLQYLHQQQQQKQKQVQLPQQTQHTYHQPNSRELESQFATIGL